MPQVVAIAQAAAVLYAKSALFRVATQVAISIGTQALVQALNKPPKPADRTDSIKYEIMPRTVNFGRTLAGSSIVYDKAAGGVRWQVHVHDHGEVQRLHKRLLNGEERAILATGEVQPDSRFRENVFCEYHSGSEDQTVSQLMLTPDTRISNAIAPGWTSNHRLRGLAYSVIRAKTPKAEYFNQVYVDGKPPVPTIEADFGKPLDPRTGQRKFIDNGALLFGWFLTHPLGMALPESKINWDSFAAAANATDLLGYKIAGAWDATEAPKVALANMLAAMDGMMWVGRDGRVSFAPGQFQEPVIKIGSDQVLAVNSLSAGQAEGAYRTEQIVKFIDRQRDYAEVEEIAASIDADTYEPDVADLPYVPEVAQAKRVGRRIFARERAKWTSELVLNLSGLSLMNNRFFELHLPEFGIVNQLMELDGWSFDTANGNVTIPCRSTAEADFT